MVSKTIWSRLQCFLISEERLVQLIIWLLLECRNMNFSLNAIKWAHSYIPGRTHDVVSRDERSKILPVTSKVLQGSSPGPIFFSILINSLPRCLKYCKFSYISLLTIYNSLSSAQQILYPYAHMTEDANNVSR